MVEDITIKVENHDHLVVISPHGSLNPCASEKLQEIIWHQFEQGIYNLVIDLSSVDNLSASSLRLFAVSKSQAHNNGGRITLVIPDSKPGLRRVLERVGYDRLFTVHTSLDKVLNY